MKIKKEHLDKLTRGKRSGVSMGSRNIGHRLTQSERAAFERAKKSLYVSVDTGQRSNLRNVWEKYCLITQITELVLLREKGGQAQVLNGEKQIFRGTLLEAKAFISKHDTLMRENDVPSKPL
jgi:hypothetical protein